MLTVITPISPEKLESEGLSPEETELDALDSFNHPRKRRALILETLQSTDDEVVFEEVMPTSPDIEDEFRDVHSEGLLKFLKTAWTRWESLGSDGREPGAFLNNPLSAKVGTIPPLVPINVPLPRDPYQRPSMSIMGQVGYYCTDLCTPIFGSLIQEIQTDTDIIMQAVRKATERKGPVYAMPTHPGHHAAMDSFGGYCYLNQAAYAARTFQKLLCPTSPKDFRVAILDVDYHCGNGTASIFYSDPSVLMISIHCDPNFDYPFHSGFTDQTGLGSGEGATLHLPLPPQTTYDSEYSLAIDTALKKIMDFGAQAVIVSLGLDTHKGDPCTVRRAGFCLEGDDYRRMGEAIGQGLTNARETALPVVVIQEGGYRMDTIGMAATNVVLGLARTYS